MYKNYKVIVNTASGRRRYMQYLVPFVLSSNIVDRYDIWINTHNGADIEFFKQLANSFPKINLIWQPEGWVNGNASINVFYKQCIEENAIYFKLDDDIIWMEDDAIEKMVRFRVDNPDYFLVTPLVINNAQSTYLLQVCDKIKLNRYYNSACDNEILWKSGEFAAQLHLWFLNRLENNSYKDLHLGTHPTALCRFSINSILWFGKDMAKIGGIVLGDDEESLSCIIPTQLGMANCWNGDVILSHFAFFTQREQLDSCEILNKYGFVNDVFFHSKESLSLIYDQVQAILLDVDKNEDNLLKQKSPYAEYDITKDGKLKRGMRSVIPEIMWNQLRDMKNNKGYKGYILSE